MLEYVTACALLGENGMELNEANITKTLRAAGVEVSKEYLEQILSSIGGRPYSEVIASGRDEFKNSQVPSHPSGNAADQNNAKVEEEDAQESSSSSGGNMDFF